MNPNRLIPAIRDGDFALWESHAIVRYLCAKYAAGTLYPEDVQQRAVADQWMEWCCTLVFPPVIQLFFATVRTVPDARDPATIKAHTDQASAALAILDTRLADNEYVAGSTFTMADIPLGAVAYRYFNVDAERPALPNVAVSYTHLTLPTTPYV